MARVTQQWLDYIEDQTNLVLPLSDDDVTEESQPSILGPDFFLQIYEYGPYTASNRLHLQTVAIAIVSLIIHDSCRVDERA